MLCCGFPHPISFCCEKNSNPDQKDLIHAQIRQKQHLILESISWLIQVKELYQFRKSFTFFPTETTRHKDWAQQQMEKLFLLSAGFWFPRR